MIAFNAGLLAGEFGEKIVTEAAFIASALLVEVILVATFFPGTDVSGGKTFGVVAKFADDCGVSKAVVEHFVDALTGFLGQTSNFAVAMAGRIQSLGSKVQGREVR